MSAISRAALAALALLAALPARAAGPDATVPAYHADQARSGMYVVPGLTWAQARTLRRDKSFDGRVQGNVYAQPLYWHPPGAAHGLLLVVTEANMVEALDAGSGRSVWRRFLGPPARRAALPCGDIAPLGITGTPVLDQKTGALYLDTMVDQGGPRHLVYGLSLQDGAPLPGWPLDVAAALRTLGKSFDARFQNQRGALALVGDRLYLPFGGHWGDCGDYHGWVVGLQLGPQPRAFGSWSTWASKGGIWAPGGLAFDGQHLFAATGNTTGAQQWGGGEAVIRLPPDLQWRPDRQDFFTPSDWRTLDEQDTDLGGTNPLPFDLPGPQGSTPLVLALGKDGKAYLMNRNDLGGIGGAVAMQQVARRQIITAPATWREGSDVFVAFQGDGAACPGQGASGLVVLRIAAGPLMDTAWCAPLNGRGAPIVTTSDGTADAIVWIVGAGGDDRLHGFRADTGQPVLDAGGLGNVPPFATVLAAEGRLYVAGNGRVHAFGVGAAR